MYRDIGWYSGCSLISEPCKIIACQNVLKYLLKQQQLIGEFGLPLWQYLLPTHTRLQ